MTVVISLDKETLYKLRPFFWANQYLRKQSKKSVIFHQIHRKNDQWQICENVVKQTKGAKLGLQKKNPSKNALCDQLKAAICSMSFWFFQKGCMVSVTMICCEKIVHGL